MFIVSGPYSSPDGVEKAVATDSTNLGDTPPVS